MSDFTAFVQLGFRHIIDVSALDHLLFLLALAAGYRARQWRDALWVVSAFTVGHSLTLALATAGVVVFDQGAVEFLIPLTIVATTVENVAGAGRAPARRPVARALLAATFGLIHGAGFADYLRSLFLEHLAVPLLGFNVGIELAQIVALAAIAVLLAGIDAALRSARGSARTANGGWSVARLRVVGLSVVVACVAGAWAVERRPW